MKKHYNKIALAFILLGSGMLLYAGWKLFWFLTDDALIAFRYVSNSVSGYGYVWNPPPFRPVEGYTSFLWVVLLDFIWRIFNLLPPSVANYLSLVFSYLTLLVVAGAVFRMRLPPNLARFRLVWLALVLLLILSNRTFLAWTSSGMETAMFNFFFVLWIILACRLRPESSLGLFGLAASAVFVYLSRPDGILPVLCTLFLLVRCSWMSGGKIKLPRKWLLSVSSLLVAAAHLSWRRSFYGEWLPNTYYVKAGVAWPEAGIRYLSSFILEYALWVWVALWLAYVVRQLFFSPAAASKEKQELARRYKTGVSKRFSLLKRPPGFYATLTLALHLAYYTFIIGGDHFEYRVYSYLVPLIPVSFLWMLNEFNFKPAAVAGAFALFLTLSLPIPWTHWLLTRDLGTRKQTYALRMPVSSHFPLYLRWYTEKFDNLQSWLIAHLVCVRHQEHKVFYYFHSLLYPSRQEGEKIKPGPYPVLATRTVGVPGWVLPHVNILDEFGLNDYVIARSPIRGSKRLMAHDRAPPPGYVESFAPNLFVTQVGRLVLKKRKKELTWDYIAVNETYWKNKIRHH